MLQQLNKSERAGWTRCAGENDAVIKPWKKRIHSFPWSLFKCLPRLLAIVQAKDTGAGIFSTQVKRPCFLFLVGYQSLHFKQKIKRKWKRKRFLRLWIERVWFYQPQVSSTSQYRRSHCETALAFQLHHFLSISRPSCGSPTFYIDSVTWVT